MGSSRNAISEAKNLLNRLSQGQRRRSTFFAGLRKYLNRYRIDNISWPAVNYTKMRYLDDDDRNDDDDDRVGGGRRNSDNDGGVMATLVVVMVVVVV